MNSQFVFMVLIVSSFMSIVTCGGGDNSTAFKCVDFKITPPPKNMTCAELHFGYSNSLRDLRAVVVVVPGVNGDGRKVLIDHKWTCAKIKQ